MYLKRYLIPKYWRVAKKAYKWAVRPSPGPHPIDRCIPLLVLVRDVLGIAENAKEAKKIIKKGELMIDGVIRKDHRFPVGLMDVVAIPKMKMYYRVVLDGQDLVLKEIKASEISKKLCRINGKTTIKGGVTQLNLHDGRNINVEDGRYAIGDSLLIKIPEQTIIEHFKLERGANGFIIGGKNTGKKGKVLEVRKRKSMLERSMVLIQTEREKIEVPLEYFMVGTYE